MAQWVFILAAVSWVCRRIVRGGRPLAAANEAVRYAAYIRWSGPEQGAGYTGEAQLRAIREDVERRGGILVAIYRDEGRSGRRLAGRTEFARMVEDAAAGTFDVVIVHKLDRFARNLRDALNTIDVLEKTYGVAVRSVQENIDPASPFAGLIRTLMLALAETFSENLGAEVTKGQREMFEDGRHVGGIPLGYVMLNPGTRQSKLVPGPLAALIKRAFELYAGGRHGTVDIAGLLNEEWVRTCPDSGRSSGEEPPFTRDTVRYVLKNRIYVGEVRYKDEKRVDPSLAIVDEDLFAEVQDRLAREGRRPVNARRPAQRQLLTGILTCARCGGKVDGCRTGDDRRYYRDRTGAARRGCNQPTLRGRELDARVARYFARIGRMLPKDALTRVQAAVDSDTTKRDARDRITALRGELDRLGHIYRRANITQDEYDTQQHDIKRQIARYEEVLNLSLERSLTRIIETLQAIPAILPYDDSGAIAELNQGLRHVVTTICVDAEDEPCYVWSPAAQTLFDILEVDPTSVPRQQHTPFISEPIGADCVQLPLPQLPVVEQGVGRASHSLRTRRRARAIHRGPCPFQPRLFREEH